MANVMPSSSTAASEAALQQAEAEGLTLVRSYGSTGFKGVTYSDKHGKLKPYTAQTFRLGQTVRLGAFATAEEAALCYARTPEGRAAAAKAPPPPSPPLTAEEALRQAEAEGLTLWQSENSVTGYWCVTPSGTIKTPYEAQLYICGKKVRLGCFVTAEEAALAVARSPLGQVAAFTSSRPTASPRPERTEMLCAPLTAEAAACEAEAEGLTLLKSASSNSGYWNVHFKADCSSRHYTALVRRDKGKVVHLGSFATPEEAALAVARTPEGQAAAAAAAAARLSRKRSQHEDQARTMPRVSRRRSAVDFE